MRLPYDFYQSEPSILMEVYLPKKANFQGTLYETLTQGFNLEIVKRHFTDPLKQRKIKELLRRYDSISRYDDEMINGYQAIFFGYSLYEIDGVFQSEKKGIIEERVQIVRMIFKPDYDRLFKEFHFANNDRENRDEVRVLVRRFLRHSSPNVEGFIQTLPKDNLFELKRELLLVIDRWIEYVCLFVFGYVVYEICAQITKLYHEENVDLNKIEEEIWVSSLWNLGVNRICFRADRD